MSQSRVTLQTLHQSILATLKKAEKSYLSQEEVEHEDPYKPALVHVLEELNAINADIKAKRSNGLERLKGLERSLAHMGLAEKAVATSFENPSPGSAMSMSSFKDPIQQLPGSVAANLQRPEYTGTFAVPGTEKPRTGLNAFSGSVSGDGGGLVPTSRPGGSFEMSKKSEAEMDIELENASNAVFDTSLPPLEVNLSKPLNEASPSDQMRAKALAWQADEHQKSQAGLARADDTPSKIGNTHIY